MRASTWASAVIGLLVVSGCGESQLGRGSGQAGKLTVATTLLSGIASTLEFRLEGAAAHRVEVVDVQLGSEQLIGAMATTDGLTYRLNWTPTVFDEGPYQLKAKISRIGETAYSDVEQARVNLAEGALSALAPQGLTATSEASGVMLSWTAVDGVSGYYVYRTAIGAKPDASHRLTEVASHSFVDASPDPAKPAYWVAGAFENPRVGDIREATSSAPATVDVSDGQKPLVALESPACGTTIANAQSVTLKAVASDNVGVAKLTLRANDKQLHQVQAASLDYSWPLTGAENGEQRLIVEACDAAGNCNDSSPCVINVAIKGSDKTPPTVSISAPANDASYHVAMTLEVIATAADDVGVVKVEFYDGSALKSTATSAPFKYAMALSASVNGVHTITAKAYDAAGNAGVSAARQISVDIQSGNGLSAPSGLTAIAADGQVSLNWDPVSGASGYDLYWATSSGVTPQNGTKIGGVSSPYLHSGLNNGATYYYVVVATSSAGQSPASAESSAMPSGTPDTTAPTFAGVGSAVALSATQIALSWSAASDDRSAANKLRYRVFVSSSPVINFGAPTTTTPAGATSHTASGLSSETTYYVAVRAVDEANNVDANQQVVSVTTPASGNGGGPTGPFGSSVGMTANNFTITDCNNTPFDLHSQYNQYDGIVILFNWMGFT